MKRNLNLDIAKGIACIGVVILHSPFPGIIGSLISYLFKFTVPLFFMISGYFLYKSPMKSEEKIKVLKTKIMKTLKLLIVAELLYFIFNMILVFLGFEEFSDFALSWYDIIINIFTGTYFNGTLWFIYALLYSYILILLLEKLKINYSNKRCIIVMFGILIFHIISRVVINHFDIYEEWGLVRLYRSALLYGLPFVLIGYYIKQNNVKLELFPIKTVILFGLGYFVSVLQYLITRISIDQDFGSIFSAIILFIFFSSYKEIKSCKIFAFIGKNLSLYVYILHLAIITVINLIFESGVMLWINPLISVLITLLVAFIIYKCVCVRRIKI